jgi:hypothetical protein
MKTLLDNFIELISDSIDKKKLYNLLISEPDKLFYILNNKILLNNFTYTNKYIDDFEDKEKIELEKFKNTLKNLKDNANISIKYIINGQILVDLNNKLINSINLTFDDVNLIKIYYILQYTKKYNDLLLLYFNEYEAD